LQPNSGQRGVQLFRVRNGSGDYTGHFPLSCDKKGRRGPEVRLDKKKRKRKMDAVLSKLRQGIARGIARNEAIIRARKAGATLQAIGDVVGLTREWVRQIVIQQ
jgi:DNA-directed RNA polymerase sigma subunit (sigma70/sigma32)